jgi:hypothetical protein
MTFLKQLAFYLACGFGGYLFSVTCDSEGALMVGCLPAVCGFIGGIAALVIVNFKALQALDSMRFCLLFLIFGIFIMVLLFTSTQWKV